MVHAFEPLRFASITWKGKKIEWKSSFFVWCNNTSENLKFLDENYPTKASGLFTSSDHEVSSMLSNLYFIEAMLP